MIGYLNGTLLEKLPPQLILDVQGVGYEVDVPMTTFYQLPALGENVMLFIHQVVREDALLLFGFISRAERATFRQLIKVTGIGARIALAILSGMSVDELAQAVASEDIKRLSAVPGIGKKTAERLVLELRGKLVSDISTVVSASGLPFAVNGAGSHGDILHALIALGYSEKEAKGAMHPLPIHVDVSEGIRLALKGLAKG